MNQPKGEKKDVFTKTQLNSFKRLFKVASYAINFWKKDKFGISHEYALLTRRRYQSDLDTAKRGGYEERIAEEKTISLLDLMESIEEPK